MARISIAERRRRELEQAIYDSILENGFSGFSLEKVAKKAGTAKGTIHHYFRSKEELLTAAARQANRLFSETFLRLLKSATSPSEKLWLVVALNLDEEYFQPHFMRTYLLAVANGIRYPSNLHVYEVTHSRGISNLRFVLRSLVEPKQVEPIAHTIWTMIEGAWVLQAARSENIAGPVLAAIADYLKNTVPDFDSSVVNLSARPIVSD
jgi:TetR/AcrR family transcriptional repressor of bet genes